MFNAHHLNPFENADTPSGGQIDAQLMSRQSLTFETNKKKKNWMALFLRVSKKTQINK